MRVRVLAVVAVIAAGCAHRDLYCPSLRPRLSSQVPLLSAGEYEIWMRADCAFNSPPQGNEATGRLSLRPTGPDDRSPKTGEGPVHVDGWRKTPLYGFTDLDFHRVAAPVTDDPASRDPIHPGVLLELSSVHDIDPAVPDRGQTLLVGNITRGHRTWFDGDGIGLFIETWDGRCYRGHWDSVGMVAGGNGSFRVCLTPPSVPTPQRSATGGH